MQKTIIKQSNLCVCVMKKAAIVKFVGDPEYYRIGCKESEFAYCRDCERFGENCKRNTKCMFLKGHLYNAYFLEYWQGERTSLHVKGEDGVISDFNPLYDFDIIEDRDDVLNTYEATVKCISQWCNLTYGKEYKAIGYDTSDSLLVMDDSYDCYFYPKECFEILEDNHGILDKERALPVYNWSNTHVDSV